MAKLFLHSETFLKIFKIIIAAARRNVQIPRSGGIACGSKRKGHAPWTSRPRRKNAWSVVGPGVGLAERTYMTVPCIEVRPSGLSGFLT